MNIVASSLFKLKSEMNAQKRKRTQMKKNHEQHNHKFSSSHANNVLFRSIFCEQSTAQIHRTQPWLSTSAILEKG